MRQISSKIIHSSPWLSLSEDSVLSDHKTKSYYSVTRPDSVILIPITPENELLLVRVYRYPTKQYSWEFPCGAIEIGESDLDAAKREMLEETGLHIDTLIKVGIFHPVPALTSQKVTVLTAKLSQEEIINSNTRFSEGEVSNIRIYPIFQLQEMITNGEITDGLTLTALNFYQLLSSKRTV